MKLQYLGDSKDSFKWDYHDFLVSKLEYPLLNIALMMTPDDGGNDGKTEPSSFPAKGEIIEFCHSLKENQSIDLIKNIPKKQTHRIGLNYIKMNNISAAIIVLNIFQN